MKDFRCGIAISAPHLFFFPLSFFFSLPMFPPSSEQSAMPGIESDALAPQMLCPFLFSPADQRCFVRLSPGIGRFLPFCSIAEHSRSSKPIFFAFEAAAFFSSEEALKKRRCPEGLIGVMMRTPLFCNGRSNLALALASLFSPPQVCRRISVRRTSRDLPPHPLRKEAAP